MRDLHADYFDDDVVKGSAFTKFLKGKGPLMSDKEKRSPRYLAL